MLSRFVLVVAAVALLSGCGPRGYITVVSPQKTAEERKTATAIAERIFPVTNGQSLVNLQKDLAKEENQGQIREMISSKITHSDLGKCLNNYGFSDYYTRHALAQMSPQKLRAETIRLWVEQIPMDMFKKADRAFSSPLFKNTFLRMTKMEGSDVRTKLNQLVDMHEITDAQANEFYLTVEDRDIKSFLIITYSNGKRAIQNLMAEDIRNPAGVVLQFMKTHPTANAKCSIVKGAQL